ncbi:MAG: flagellar hook-length control protein FliK [Pseudothermotoga sp.]
MKVKMQKGQIDAPQFVNLANTQEQKKIDANNTEANDSKSFARITNTAKQTESIKNISSENLPQPAVVSAQKDNGESEQIQKEKVPTDLKVKPVNNQKTEQKQDEGEFLKVQSTTDHEKTRTETIKSTSIKTDTQNFKNLANVRDSQIQDQEQATVQSSGKQEKLANQQIAQTIQKPLVQHKNTNDNQAVDSSSKVATRSNEENQSLDRSSQTMNMKKAKDGFSASDQMSQTVQKQNTWQITQNNKSSQNIEKTNVQNSSTEQPRTQTSSIQDKYAMNPDQTVITQMNQIKQGAPTIQQTVQHPSHKRAPVQQNLQEQNITADKPTRTVLSDDAKTQFQTNDLKPQVSYKIVQEQNIESSKTLKNIQTLRDSESKSTKANLRSSQQSITNESQDQQKIVLSRNTLESLVSQSQSNLQSTTENNQKTKERSQKSTQQSGVIVENLIASKNSVAPTTSQTPSITVRQAQVIIRNAIIQIQDSTSEFTQFKQIKRELPDQLKTSQPIKIENFKLEIARDLKKDSPQIIQQPQPEKLHQTEQIRELMNTKLARKTYENEQTVQNRQQLQQTIETVMVRVEQQEKSSNIQTIAETIRQMQNSSIEKATVDLSPPNLGKLEIEILKQQDRLMITLKVATDETKEMIEKSSKDLMSRLNALGFKVEQIDVKTTQKAQEDQLYKDQDHEQNQHQNERRHKRYQQEEVNEDDKRD